VPTAKLVAELAAELAAEMATQLASMSLWSSGAALLPCDNQNDNSEGVTNRF